MTEFGTKLSLCLVMVGRVSLPPLVVKWLWYWFVVPYTGALSLSYWGAFGLCVLVYTAQRVPIPEYTDHEDALKGEAHRLMRWAWALAIGWTVSWGV